MRSLISTALFLAFLGSASAQQLRVIEFGDHPDPNSGTPRVVQAARPWPADVVALIKAVSDSTERHAMLSDMRHGTLPADSEERLEETNVRVLETTADGARVRVRMASSPTIVDAFVPMNGTAVIGSDSADEHHAYVAVSLMDGLPPNEVFSPREPGVTAPVKIRGALPRATPFAIVHRLAGVMVETQIDRDGNVVSAQPLMRRGPSAAGQAAIEQTILTWKFRPAMRNGKPVPVLTPIAVRYSR